MSKSPAPRNELNLTPMGRAVAAFDAAWQSAAEGQAAPRLEAVLTTVPQAQRSVYLRALLAVELQFRAKLGDSPGATDYLDRFPLHVETIQAIFEECSTVALQERSPIERFKQPAQTIDTEAQPATPTGERSLKPGTVLGNYTIRRLIGQGGMGAVYQAEHRLMRRNVAIKIISQAALQHPEALARFHREVQAVARLEHPNIVTAHDADQAGDINFLVMQYIEGDDLSTAVKTRGPLSIDMALRFLVQTARGLEYAHQEGVIHRDIKPSNLIVARNGIVKILDMGLARLQASLTENSSGNRNLTEAGNIMGTVDFMAPEQALDAKEADERADIYSLGCTLYYLLTGRTMYHGDTLMKRIVAHRCDSIPALHAVRSDVPAWLETVFQKMVAKDRQDRYQSMMELLTTVAPHVASGLSGPETEVSVPGHRSGADDPAVPRPIAALLVRFPDSDPAAPKFMADGTSPTAGFTTLTNAVTTWPSVPAAKPSPVRTDPVRTDPVKTDPVKTDADGRDPVGSDTTGEQETGAPPETGSWRTPRANRETTSRTGMSGRVTIRKRRRLLGAVAVYMGLLLVVTVVAVNYFGSDTGTIVIEAADPEVEAVLTDIGIRMLDVKTKRAFALRPGRHNLKFGDYEVDVAELPDGIEISTTEFRLERGDTETLTITLARKDD